MVLRALSVVEAPKASQPDDYVALAYSERYRRRGLLTTGAGAEILLDLPEATELTHGDLLMTEDGRAIEIRALAEPLAEIRGDGLVRLAWHIGNRHTPCQVEDDRLLIQRDHVLEDMLAGLGAGVCHVDEPFRPEGGAYGHGRTHAHGHAHDAFSDPNAHIPHRHD